MKIPKRVSVTLLVLVLGACASYQAKVGESRNELKNGQIQAALEKLKPLAEKPGDDQLVYLMDYGTALQIAGQYKESTEALLRADRLTELNDYHSASNVALATLGSETMIQYKGDSFEKILINAMLAMDYIMMGQFDDAVVEARRVNDKITKFRQDGRKNYELNPFANYLTGIIWEAAQKWDDAYISYSDAYKIDATNPELPEDLLRLAKKSRRMDDYQDWKQKLTKVNESPEWYDPNMGQIVILVEQGWAPEKRMIGEGVAIHVPNTVGYVFRSLDRRKFPYMVPVSSETNYAEAIIEGRGTVNSRMVYNVEKVAIQTFEDDLGSLMLRRAAADAAKAVATDQVRQKNELLGFLAGIAMQAADRPDLRQWSTLPRTMQVARKWLPPGTYKVNLQGLRGPGQPTGDHLENQTVTVRPGKISFLVWRTLH